MLTERKARFQILCPGVYYLDHTDPASVEAYLSSASRLPVHARVIEVEKAGEGNMNCTARVRTSAGASFILKQARPWLEKYPQIAAPFDRTLIEGRFYQLIEGAVEVSSMMPRLLWLDEANRVVAFEDLGEASDFFPLYERRATLDDATLLALVKYLGALHALPMSAETTESMRNTGMRALNHEHIFALPLRHDNGLDANAFTPGLAAVGERLKRDPAYQRVAAELGQRYLLGSGKSLVHGDFFPGSFLRTVGGVRVIDPEFGFCGDPEYDLGVLAGHLLLAGEPARRADEMLALYQPPQAGAEFQPERVRQYAGIEIMRRLLGVAQIPTLAADLGRKTELLELSRRLVVEPEGDFQARPFARGCFNP